MEDVTWFSCYTTLSYTISLCVMVHCGYLVERCGYLVERYPAELNFSAVYCTLLYLSGSTRGVIGQFCGPYFTVRPAKFESAPD